MPMKYKPSELRIDKDTKKRYKIHYYMSHVSTEKLMEELSRASTRPKLKDKIRRELVKRGLANG